jgi:hypothetical protein
MRQSELPRTFSSKFINPKNQNNIVILNEVKNLSSVEIQEQRDSSLPSE